MRIDLVEPTTSERESIAEFLRGLGHEVSERALADVPRTTADVLIMAGDAEGAIEVLRALRDEGSSPDTPVILLGAPSGVPAGGPALSARAVLGRPVSLSRLGDVLELAPPQTSVSQRPVRRERTLQLVPRTSPPSSSERTPSPIGEMAEVSTDLRALLREADRRVFPDRAPIDLELPGGELTADELVPSELFEDEPAELERLGDADPLDQFTFVGSAPAPPPRVVPAPDSSVEQLESGENQVEDRQTSPGTPARMSRRPPSRAPAPPSAPPPAESQGSQRSAADDSREVSEPLFRAGAMLDAGRVEGSGVHEARMHPPARDSEHGERRPGGEPHQASSEENDWPENDTVLGRAGPDGERRGSLGAGGVLRLLFRVRKLRLDARLSLQPGDGAGPDALTLVFRRGELALARGELTRDACEQVLGTRPGSELEARQALESAVEVGRISELMRERSLRHALERALRRLIAAERASFVLRRELTDVGSSAPPLGRSIRAVLVELSRSAFSSELSRRILDPAHRSFEGVAFTAQPELDALAQDAGIEPELISLIKRRQGQSAAELLDEAPLEVALPGLLCALLAAGALVAIGIPGASASVARRPRADEIRRWLEDNAARAEEGDYFTVLGLDREAEDRDVIRGYELRHEQASQLDLRELGLIELEPSRQRILAALEEARRVLSNPRWRAAYAAAIG